MEYLSLIHQIFNSKTPLSNFSSNFMRLLLWFLFKRLILTEAKSQKSIIMEAGNSHSMVLLFKTRWFDEIFEISMVFSLDLG